MAKVLTVKQWNDLERKIESIEFQLHYVKDGKEREKLEKQLLRVSKKFQEAEVEYIPQPWEVR